MFSEIRCAKVFCPKSLLLPLITAGAVVFNSIAEDTHSTAAPKFLGSQSCSSSSCHGGADEKHNQYTIWLTHDFHHARPYATLETARSERLAEVLKISNPTQSARCTICHAPFQTVPAEHLGPDAKATEGISCESCHGPAENWIRSHTRSDYTHADRVASGMRDLKNPYVRANTCVACHQNLDPEIRAAGHPELIFEMNGQSADMPRHWLKAEDNGPDTWFVGQAVALREMSWELLNQRLSNQELSNRWAGLLWVLNQGLKTKLKIPSTGTEGVKYVQQTFDGFARDIGSLSPTERKDYSPAGVEKTIQLLSDTSDDFKGKNTTDPILARRAERLVLALDRLTRSLEQVRTNGTVNESLNRLFADAQSLPDFDPKQFAKDLNTFHSSVAGYLETK